MGLERRRCGVGPCSVGDVEPTLSSLAAAVLGLSSIVGGLRLRSFDDGLDADNTDDRDPDTECPPCRIVMLELSLETSERGLGMNCISSENPTRARFILGGILLSSVSGHVTTSMPGNGR